MAPSRAKATAVSMSTSASTSTSMSKSTSMSTAFMFALMMGSLIVTSVSGLISPDSSDTLHEGTCVAYVDKTAPNDYSQLCKGLISYDYYLPLGMTEDDLNAQAVLQASGLEGVNGPACLKTVKTDICARTYRPCVDGLDLLNLETYDSISASDNSSVVYLPFKRPCSSTCSAITSTCDLAMTIFTPQAISDCAAIDPDTNAPVYDSSATTCHLFSDNFEVAGAVEPYDQGANGICAGVSNGDVWVAGSDTFQLYMGHGEINSPNADAMPPSQDYIDGDGNLKTLTTDKMYVLGDKEGMGVPYWPLPAPLQPPRVIQDLREIYLQFKLGSFVHKYLELNCAEAWIKFTCHQYSLEASHQTHLVPYMNNVWVPNKFHKDMVTLVQDECLTLPYFNFKGWAEKVLEPNSMDVRPYMTHGAPNVDVNWMFLPYLNKKSGEAYSPGNPGWNPDIWTNEQYLAFKDMRYNPLYMHPLYAGQEVFARNDTVMMHLPLGFIDVNIIAKTSNKDRDADVDMSRDMFNWACGDVRVLKPASHHALNRKVPYRLNANMEMAMGACSKLLADIDPQHFDENLKHVDSLKDEGYDPATGLSSDDCVFDYQEIAERFTCTWDSNMNARLMSINEEELATAAVWDQIFLWLSFFSMLFMVVTWAHFKSKRKQRIVLILAGSYLTHVCIQLYGYIVYPDPLDRFMEDGDRVQPHYQGWNYCAVSGILINGIIIPCTDVLVVFMAVDVYLKIATKVKVPEHAWKYYAAASFVFGVLGKCLYWYGINSFAGFDGINSCLQLNQYYYTEISRFSTIYGSIVFSIVIYCISTLLFAMIVFAVLKSVGRVKSSVGPGDKKSYFSEIMKTIKLIRTPLIFAATSCLVTAIITTCDLARFFRDRKQPNAVYDFLIGSAIAGKGLHELAAEHGLTYDYKSPVSALAGGSLDKGDFYPLMDAVFEDVDEHINEIYGPEHAFIKWLMLYRECLVNVAGPATLFMVFLCTSDPYKLWLKKFGLIDTKNGAVSSTGWTIVKNNKRLSMIARYFPAGGNAAVGPSMVSDMQSEMESNMNSVAESCAPGDGDELTKKTVQG